MRWLAASSIGLSPLNFPFQIVSCLEKSRKLLHGASSNPSAAAARRMRRNGAATCACRPHCGSAKSVM